MRRAHAPGCEGFSFPNRVAVPIVGLFTSFDSALHPLSPLAVKMELRSTRQPRPLPVAGELDESAVASASAPRDWCDDGAAPLPPPPPYDSAGADTGVV
jgi:hypothetical protein